MSKTRQLLASAVLVGLVTAGTAACEDTTGKSGTGKSSTAKSKDKGPASSKTVAEEFKAYVGKTGTAAEQAAAKKVVKIQGGDSNNDILDTADIHTSITGDLFSSEATAKGKLLASAFADFQESRGKSSKNGLVTVYNASGDMLSNGKY